MVDDFVVDVPAIHGTPDEDFVVDVPSIRGTIEPKRRSQTFAEDAASVFVIEVLEGETAGQRVVLRGRALPFRAGSGGSIAYETEQHSVLTWYPGNPIAGQQILGAREQPMTINGQWSDRYLGPGQAAALEGVFLGLCRSGVQVRVIWGVRVGQGIVKRVKTAPGMPTGGAGDLGWEITFEWNRALDRDPPALVNEAAGEYQTEVIATAEGVAIMRTSLLDKLDELEFSNGVPQASTSTFVRGSREQLDEVDRISADLATIASSLAGGDSSSSTIERAIATAESALSRCRDLGGAFGGLFHGAASPSDSLIDVVAVAVLRAEAVRATLDVSGAAWSLLDRSEKLARPERHVVVVAVPGTDLRKLAIRYYGDADLWHRIAKANGLEDSVVPEGVAEIDVPIELPPELDDRGSA